MLDQGQISEIVQAINEESLRIKYGKIFIELNVVDSQVFDMDILATKKKRLPKISVSRKIVSIIN